jgi:large subunit ribosomal protein L33
MGYNTRSMAKKGARELVALICTVCKNQNYLTERNKINMETKGKKGSKLEIKKYCKHCRKIQLHKESSKLK